MMSTRQRRAFYAVLVAAGVIVAVVLGTVFMPGGRGRVGGVWAAVAVFALLPMLHVLIYRLNSAVDATVDNLKAKQFKVCDQCRYDLTKHADEGVCPECGKAYTRASLEAAWRRVYPMHL